MAKFTVELHSDEKQALIDLAKEDCRPCEWEARWLIVAEAKRRGIWRDIKEDKES